MAIFRDLHFAHNARSLKRGGDWYYHFEYPIERERGLDFQEDLFCPCVLEFDLAPRKPAIVIASTVAHNASECGALKANEIGASRAPSRQTRLPRR